jgi:hypothetical protein
MGEDVNAPELACSTQVVTKLVLQLLRDLVRLALKLLGTKCK